MEGRIKVTRHAEKRIRERSGIPKRAIKRSAQLAFDTGYRHSETKGRLREFLDAVYLREGTANNMRVFGDKVYVFCNHTLVTVLQIPASIMKNIHSYVKEDAQ